MTALASTTDYETLTGQHLDDAEVTRVGDLLEMASEAVLAGAHGQNITSQTYTDATLYVHEGRFLFPQRPVTAVSSVVVDGTTYTTDDYRWIPGGDGRPAELIYRVSGYDRPWPYHEAVVTYTAGWATVPFPLRAAVVAMASGAYRGSTNTVITTTAGGAPIPEYPAINIALTALKLTPAVQAVIDTWCKVRLPASVEVSRG